MVCGTSNGPQDDMGSYLGPCSAWPPEARLIPNRCPAEQPSLKPELAARYVLRIYICTYSNVWTCIEDCIYVYTCIFMYVYMRGRGPRPGSLSCC